MRAKAIGIRFPRQKSYELLRPRMKIKNMYWEFHKGDADFNPSLPHGHSLKGHLSDGKYKLELWSGDIYDVYSGKRYGTAKAKDMKRLFNLRVFQEFVEECRKEYQEAHPGIALPKLAANREFSTSRCSGIIGRRAHKKRAKYRIWLRYDR